MEVLSNKQFIDYDRLSRYQNTPFYYHEADDKYTMGVANGMKKTTSYSLYTVSNGETLDIIALKCYGNPTYYWIIADFNNIVDCLEPLNAGATIAVPTLTAVELN